jgi:hypothetical protein
MWRPLKKGKAEDKKNATWSSTSESISSSSSSSSSDTTTDDEATIETIRGTSQDEFTNIE